MYIRRMAPCTIQMRTCMQTIGLLSGIVDVTFRCSRRYSIAATLKYHSRFFFFFRIPRSSGIE